MTTTPTHHFFKLKILIDLNLHGLPYDSLNVTKSLFSYSFRFYVLNPFFIAYGKLSSNDFLGDWRLFMVLWLSGIPTPFFIFSSHSLSTINCSGATVVRKSRTSQCWTYPILHGGFHTKNWWFSGGFLFHQWLVLFSDPLLMRLL